MKITKLLMLSILIMASVSAEEYWQNYVHYKIDVTLDDSHHFLYGKEEITYFNNSPDTLKKIHLLLYPNAYKNNHTHFARQQKLYGKKEFLNSSDDGRGFIDIGKFLVNNDSMEIIIPEDSISTGYVLLSNPMLPGDSVKIYTEWQVKIPLSYSRMCHSDQKYYISQWFPKIPVYDKRGWHPYPYLTIGEFYYEFGDYEVNITVPKNYVVAATGELISPVNEFHFLDSLSIIAGQVMKMSDQEYDAWKLNNLNPVSSTQTKTLTYKATNVVDFVWTASKEHLVQKSKFAYENSTDSIGVWNFFLPDNRDSWKNCLVISKATLSSYGKLCGPYPYPNVTVVDGDLTAGGGMEYPMLTIINSTSMEVRMWQVVAHEIGHNWFYGVLGFNERQEAWMDEGLNTFGEMRFMEEEFPDSLSPLNNIPFSKLFKILTSNFNLHDVYQTYMAKARFDEDIQASDLNGFLYTSGNSYNVSVYVKPAMGFRLLESYVGKENFYFAMNRFYEEWKFRHPQPTDLQTSFEETLNMDLNWLFKDYISTTKLPDYTISSFKKQRNEDIYLSTIKIENQGEARQPYDLAVYKNGKELDKKWSAGTDTSEIITFESSEKPDKAIISPTPVTIEESYYNNYSSMIPPIDVNFLFNIPTVNRYMLNFIPYANYNYSEGIKLGGGFYHITPTIPQNTYYLYGTYSPKTNHFNGNAMFFTKIKGQKKDYNLTGHFGTDIIKNKIGGILDIKNKKSNHGIVLHANYMDIKNDDYLDNNFWTSGKFMNFQIDKIFPTEIASFDIRAKYNHSLDDGENFLKLTGEITKNIKTSEKIHLNNRIFVGTIFGNLDQLPKQLRFFPGGGIDPDFEQIYMFDRTGETRFSPLYNYHLQEGISLRGYQQHTDSDGLAGGNHWAFGYNFEIERSHIFSFFDIGSVVSENEDVKFLWDAGVGFKLMIFKFHFPLYVSDPYDGYDNFTNWNALKRRWMVSLDLSRFSIMRN